jgi:uncharacterized protein with ParB-like and HNH nuclease domain
MQDNKNFQISIVSLEDLQKYQFSIPTYQRPYVWGNEQIEKLIKDFYKTFEINKNDEYFIGTILTKENGNKAELVDGQQRFTTLWLTAYVFSKLHTKSNLENFLKNSDGSLKFDFEIRSEVSAYFEKLLDSNLNAKAKELTSDSILKFPYLVNIATALTTIESIIAQLDQALLNEFGNYIYTKVKLIKNTTPEHINLNKLFSTINSAGVQLEQTDIVKANLLKILDDKVVYGKIWEVCENMNNYFERNVRSTFPKTDKHIVDLSNFVAFDKAIFKYEEIIIDNLNLDKNFSIDEIELSIIDEYVEVGRSTDIDKRESEEVYCRSIINFGQLLLHTYRLHLFQEGLPDFEGTFHINRLIEIFNTLEKRNDKLEVERFFILLWKVRFLLDKYVVKWISNTDTKTETLELLNINKNAEDYYSRTKYESSMTHILQSVLYFTGDYLRQFWLTSYLGHLLKNHNNLKGDDSKHLKALENIDNQLSLCANLTDKEASLQLLDGDLPLELNFEQYLQSSLGTKFKHYWFYKLEYILYKNWEFEKSDEFKNYRITSKNSVEHIYPQHPENQNKNPIIDQEYLDSFGNLVLLSVSQNSEYSNNSVEVKRSMFFTKSNTFDTLKSYYIFKQYNTWTSDEIIAHNFEMIKKLKSHYHAL